MALQQPHIGATVALTTPRSQILMGANPPYWAGHATSMGEAQSAGAARRALRPCELAVRRVPLGGRRGMASGHAALRVHRCVAGRTSWHRQRARNRAWRMGGRAAACKEGTAVSCGAGRGSRWRLAAGLRAASSPPSSAPPHAGSRAQTVEAEEGGGIAFGRRRQLDGRAGVAYDSELSPSHARARADGEEPTQGQPAGSCTWLRAYSGELRPLAFPATVPVPWIAAVFLDAVDRRRCQLPAAKNRPTEFATSPWCCRTALLALSWTGARDRELPVRYPCTSLNGVRVLGTAHRRPGLAPHAPRPHTPTATA
ncbi:uncharacterized protein [Miscanthus floridulus]|uniref:uncharacterized protein n=1 Tax=Miscanthus floridulus TaxID=154761 RepID=UPI003457BB5F